MQLQIFCTVIYKHTLQAHMYTLLQIKWKGRHLYKMYSWSVSELFDDDVADAKRNRKGARWVECVDQEKDPTFIPELPTEWDCEWKNIIAFDPHTFIPELPTEWDCEWKNIIAFDPRWKMIP